jgi:putative addiction module component (TIGR02574 family)
MVFGGIMVLMTNQALEILQKALALSDEERASIAGSLLKSLDASTDEGVETAWAAEIDRRIDELDSGKATTVPWEELRARTLSRLSNAKRSR